MAAYIVMPATACLPARQATRLGTARMPPTDAAFTIQPDSSALGTFHEDTLQAELSDLSKILLSYDLTESCSPDRNIVVKPMDTTEVPVRLVDIRPCLVLVRQVRGYQEDARVGAADRISSFDSSTDCVLTSRGGKGPEAPTTRRRAYSLPRNAA